MHGENPFVLSRFQTRLLCIQKKPCLRSKEALFAVQRSLVCKPGKTRLPRNAAIGRLPTPSAWSARQLPAHEKGGAKTANLFISMIKVVSGGGKSALFFVTLQVKNCTRQCGNGFFFAAFALPLQDAKPFLRVLYGKGRALFSKGSMPVSVGKGAAAVCKS